MYRRFTHVHPRHGVCILSGVFEAPSARRDQIPKSNERNEARLPHPIPVARPTIAWTKLPDGAVLFSPESEVYYAMNNVGALIWELLPQTFDDLDALCLAVHDRFPDASIDQIRDDVVDLLNELAQNGLVTTAPEIAAA